MKHLSLIIAMLTCVMVSHAQIGYQVALLNRANGEPRANETVNVTVTISDGTGVIVCTETKSETSNEFGILSMSIGAPDTFADTDWSKLPFYIEATVDDVLIGKSQLLSVPIAEHAKHYGSLSKKILTSKKWTRVLSYKTHTVSFFEDGTCTIDVASSTDKSKYNGNYYIDGNTVYIICPNGESEVEDIFTAHYIPVKKILIFDDDDTYRRVLTQ